MKKKKLPIKRRPREKQKPLAKPKQIISNEARIESESKAALVQAYRAIDEGTELLLKLIREKNYATILKDSRGTTRSMVLRPACVS